MQHRRCLAVGLVLVLLCVSILAYGRLNVLQMVNVSDLLIFV